jgi:hypothetical protein
VPAGVGRVALGRGWTCPKCGHGRAAGLARRALLQCNRCRHQVSLTAGTIFHATKLPLVVWFQAIYHLSQSKGGISSIELGRRLGVRQPTAWLLKQKLMQAMATRETVKPKLEGRVEIDDPYLGGQRSGGKRGRGAAGKTPFVGRGRDHARGPAPPAQADRGQGLPQDGGRAGRQGFLGRGQRRAQRRSLLLAGGGQGRLRHWPMPTGPGRQAARWTPFKWFNPALGNIKTALSGTQHAQCDLASFAWRFNRRYQLDSLTERLAYACIHARPHPYRAIVG